MTQKMIRLMAAVALALGLASTPAIAQGIKVVGAGAGVYPPNTLFNGVHLSGLQFGFGVRVPGNGTASGQFQMTLIGTSALGQSQIIELEGQAATGSAIVGSTSRFSGSVAVNMGDGTPPLAGVPFTLTIVPNAVRQGTLTLVLGAVTLPAATVNKGSITIR